MIDDYDFEMKLASWCAFEESKYTGEGEYYCNCPLPEKLNEPTKQAIWAALEKREYSGNWRDYEVRTNE